MIYHKLLLLWINIYLQLWSPAEELVGTKRESALVVPGVPLNPLHTVQNTALRDMYLEKTEFLTLKVGKIRKLCFNSQAKKY